MWRFFCSAPKVEKRPRAKTAIRLEAVGGQGANSAGKILAEAAVLGEGFTGNHYSSFGSEKRGAPVRSFVRFSAERLPIRSASAIEHPDILAIFHDSLLLTHPEILAGVREQTAVVLNTARPVEELLPEGLRCRYVVTVDATALARKHRCGLNAVMLGAMTPLVWEVGERQVADCLDRFFAGHGDGVRKNNHAGFVAGRSGSEVREFSEVNASLSPAEKPPAELPQLGWLNSAIGGVVINPGNSVLKDHSASRMGVVPKFLREVCFDCGFCDMICPDYCFVWRKDPVDQSPRLQGIDYQYCKGCQKCVAICPVEALVPVLEDELSAEDRLPRLHEQSRDAVERHARFFNWSSYIERISPDERMLTVQTELLDEKSYLRPDFSGDEIVGKKKKEAKE